MTEPRRVQLTTLSSSSAGTGLLTPVSPAGPCGLDPGPVRLVLTLFEPTERAFPEFSYTELLRAESRSEQQEQEELTQITQKQLEEKYGAKPRQDRVQDLIDMGDGYDDEDSFIDNSEAYDEFVPASITTKLGGFYVNSGLLQFRQASDTEPEGPPEEPPEEPGKRPPAERRRRRREASKKRKLKNGLEKSPNNHCDDAEGLAKPSSVSESVEEMLKKKKKSSTLSMTSALRKCEKERERQMFDQSGASARGPSLGLNTLALGPADAGGGGCVSLPDPLLRLMGSTQGLAQDSDLDCVLVSEDSSSTHSLPPTVTDTCGLLALPDGTEPGGHTKAEDTASQACPEAFPPALEESIHKLLMASKTSEGESKVKFYTPEINDLLLQIDVQCRQHRGPLRSRVYSHLCSFLPCNKDTLLRRVGRLKHSRNEEPDVGQLMETLKKAIEKTMPEQILSWKELRRTHEHSVMVPEEEREEGAGRRPKKHFKWNDDIREGLRRLLKLKLEQFQRECRGQDVDLYLHSLLEGQVKALWPKGWMSTRILLKEGRKLLSPGLMPVKKLEKNKPSISTASCASAAVTPGLRGVAADTNPALSVQCPAHLQPPLQPQELLVAAVARYKLCAQRWGFSEVIGSPPLPPPPPQSSPTHLPLTPLSGLPPALDPTKNM